MGLERVELPTSRSSGTLEARLTRFFVDTQGVRRIVSSASARPRPCALALRLTLWVSIGDPGCRWSVSISAPFVRRPYADPRLRITNPLKRPRQMARNYLVFVRNVPGKPQSSDPSRMQDMMAAFVSWKQKYGANIVDMG